ncbi:MAG: phosphoribosylglycinamide formyltransferase [Christensenellales bacterium]|jgi:phosphoribosylglycinamide formyltransferase-1
MKKLVVMASGGGTNMQAVMDACESGFIPARVAGLIVSRPDAYALNRAKNHGVDAMCIRRADHQDAGLFDEAVCEALGAFEPDLIVLAGYLSILGPKVISRYRNRIINIHPSLMPAFCGPGFYGERVHQSVLDYGAKVSGATVHFVDEGTDTGPVILQKPVCVHPEDDVYSLAQRVLKVEHELLPLAVKYFVEGRIEVQGRKVTIRDCAYRRQKDSSFE